MKSFTKKLVIPVNGAIVVANELAAIKRMMAAICHAW